jgi:hypothetical protein
MKYECILNIWTSLILCKKCVATLNNIGLKFNGFQTINRHIIYKHWIVMEVCTRWYTKVVLILYMLKNQLNTFPVYKQCYTFHVMAYLHKLWYSHFRVYEKTLWRCLYFIALSLPMYTNLLWKKTYLKCYPIIPLI